MNLAPTDRCLLGDRKGRPYYITAAQAGACMATRVGSVEVLPNGQKAINLDVHMLESYLKATVQG
jgi:hypothetical protein